MKRSRRKPLSPEEREQATEFQLAARSTERCAMCRTFGALVPLDAHHVVEKQELKSRKLPLYDKRNVLALCRPCHANHTSAAKRVPSRKLRAANIDYAYEVLGPFAAEYIRARYPMAGDK